MAKQDADTFDLQRALIGLAAPPAEVVEAGFFHRTLARWLGLPEGRVPGRAAPDVSWSYSFWKAELTQTSAEEAGKQRWEAHVFRGPTSTAERYAYWIELDERARIRRSGWLTAAPDLLREDTAFGADSPPGPFDSGTLRRIFEADDDAG